MFYLIGGAPRSGKTTITKQLSRKLNIPWISTDTMEDIAKTYTPKEQLDILFPKDFLRRKTNQNNDDMYTAFSTEQIADAYFEQAKNLAKAIERFIRTESAYEHEFVIEGHHISPQLAKELKKEFPITALFVGREDVVLSLEAITSDPNQNDWVTAKTKNTDTYRLISKMLTTLSTRNRKWCEKCDQEYFSMEGNFEERVSMAVEKLMPKDNI